MKTITMKKIVALLVYYGLCMLPICLGAEFRNLGFDEVDLSGLPTDGTGDPKLVLPGWSLLRGGEPYGVVYVNQLLLDNWDYDELGDYHQFGDLAEGKYGLYLVRRDDSSPVWSLEQTGTIPVGTKYLTYRSGYYYMEVQINDEIIPLLDWRLPGGGPNLVYDVSAYAGQEVKLALVGPYGPCGVFSCGKETYIDSITFLAEVPQITAVVQTAPGTTTNQVTLRFTPIAGRDMDVDFRDDLSRNGTWQTLPRSPDTPGMVIDKTPADHRIYRLRISVRRKDLP